MSYPAPKLPPGIAREIARQAEVRLDAILKLATAQDARATSLFGIFGAASVALAAAVLTHLGTAQVRLLWSGSVSAFLLFIAAVVAGWAGAPRGFWVAGSMPTDLRDWAWDGQSWRSESELLDATAQRLRGFIERDWQLLEFESRRVRGSLWVALAAVAGGLIAYWVVGYLV